MKQYSPLEQAIEYIEAHLHEGVSLHDVSRETGYSYYYMTRLFSSVLGESVGHYIRRRRLYRAAEKLIHTRQRVIDIALEWGFASPEAFSRAFKAAFGTSPADYRKAGLDFVVNAKRGLLPEAVSHVANNISHVPELLVLDETKIAGLRGTTSLSDNRLPALWKQFREIPADYFAAGTRYGICETQQTVYSNEGDVSFSALVGGPVAEFHHLPQTLATKTLGGKYAVFTHRGTFANLFQSYRYLFETWLPSAEEELDDREDFELYEREVQAFDDPDKEVKIFIPVT